MKYASAQGYCAHLFNAANMNFVAWWNGDDPILEGKPSELAEEMPKLVIERAETLVEFEKETAA